MPSLKSTVQTFSAHLSISIVAKLFLAELKNAPTKSRKINALCEKVFELCKEAYKMQEDGDLKYFKDMAEHVKK